MTILSFPLQVSNTVKANRRQTDQLLSYFDSAAEGSRHLLSKAVRKFEGGAEEYVLARYLWSGPPGGGDTLRLGLFATLGALPLLMVVCRH